MGTKQCKVYRISINLYNHDSYNTCVEESEEGEGVDVAHRQKLHFTDLKLPFTKIEACGLWNFNSFAVCKEEEH